MALALLVAGVLGGGAFGFAAGLATGYQMSPVAYRGDLPPPPERAVTAEGSAPSAVPRETQTAATPPTAPEAAPTPSTAAVATSAGADAIQVALPERTRWHGGWSQDSASGTLSYQDVPLPPSKPRPARTQTASLEPVQGSGTSTVAVSLAPRDWPAATPASLQPQGTPPVPPRTPERTDRPEAAAPPAVPADTGPRAAPTHGRYSVQVGAFRDRDNAVELAAQMSDQGYPVRIVHEQATQSRLYMVRLGAFPDRPAALAYATQIARAEGVDTWPVRN